jgi:hypothetical protein
VKLDEQTRTTAPPLYNRPPRHKNRTKYTRKHSNTNTNTNTAQQAKARLCVRAR